MSLTDALSFVTQVAEQAPPLMRNARTSLGSEIRGVVAERLSVGLMVNIVIIQPEGDSIEEIWIGFELPPIDGPCELPPQPEWLAIVLAAILPNDANMDQLQYGLPFPRATGSKPNEITVYWCSL